MRKTTVLVADDSAFIRTSLKTILEQNGYVVVGLAENGVDAIAKYKELRPEVVFLDIIMAQLDGLQTLRVLRQLNPELKAIMVTSIAARLSVLDCVKAGAKNYILKPFEPARIVEALQKVLAPSTAPSVAPAGSHTP